MRKGQRHWLTAGIATFAGLSMLLSITSPIASAQEDVSDLKPVTSSATSTLALPFDDSLADSSQQRNRVKMSHGHVTYIPGVVGYAARLDNATLDLGASQTLQPSSFTYSFWYRPVKPMSGEQIFMWAKSQYNRDGWYLASNPTLPLTLSIGIGTNGPGQGQPLEFNLVETNRSKVFPTGKWTHVMVIWNGQTKQAQIFINGIGQALRAGNTAAESIVKPTNDRKYIGQNGPYGGDPMNGDLDEVKLWSVAGNTSDIEREVKAGDPSFSAHLQAQNALASLVLPKEAESNLDLPAQTVNGATLTWVSSSPSVVSAQGIVNRQKTDQQVTLTATAVFGSQKATKSFTITVPKRDTTPLSFTGLHESDMKNVIVSDAYLKNAAQKEIAYLLHFDTDRFLVEFRKQAGLSTKGKKNYGGWERGYGEGARFTGHFVGHYISALSEARRSTFATQEQSENLEAHLERMVSGIRQAQLAYAKKDPMNAGFLPAFKVTALPNGADGLLVPFYDLHKVEQGLVDASKWSSDSDTRTKAKSAAVDFAKFIVSWKSRHNNVNMLSTEYGGMNDALYQVAQIANPADKPTVLKAAHLFDEVSLFKTLASGIDNLNGKHANTTIPKLTGAMQRYVTYEQDPSLYTTLSDNDRAELKTVYLKAAENFWTFVTTNRSYANGDNSQSEHFHVSGQLWHDATQHGDTTTGGGYSNNSTSETCNAHNMLKLTRLLLQVTKQVKYSEYYEHTYINAILASQNPQTGMTTYFQPMKAGYPKVFGVPEGEFWCCQGTGIENFSKLADSFYFTSDHDIYVNMFRSSTFMDSRHNIKLVQVANVPKQETVTYVVSQLDPSKPIDSAAALKLRIPAWTSHPVLVANGKRIDLPHTDSNGWVTVPLKNGTKVTYTLPAHVSYTTVPDNANWVSFTYGPLVLAGSLTPTDPNHNWGYGGILVRTAAYDPKANAMAVIFPGETSDGRPLPASTWLNNISTHLIRTDSPNDGGSLSFRFQGAGKAADAVKVQPYYSLYKTTYALYFDIADVDSEAYQNMILTNKESARQQAQILGSVTPDQGNNIEMGANLQHSDNSSSDSYDGKVYRDAKAGGWFSYDLKVSPTDPEDYISVNYNTADTGRSFDLYADPTPLSGVDMKAGKRSSNAQKIATVIINNKAGHNVFYWQSYEIPCNLRQKAKRDLIRFFFVSTGGLVGGVYGIRTVSSLKYSDDADLKSLIFNGGVLSPRFNPRQMNYVLTVSKDQSSVQMSLSVPAPGAFVRFNGIVIDDTKTRTIQLAGPETDLEIESVAQDHSATRHYSVAIIRRGNVISPKTSPVIEYTFSHDHDKTVTNTGSASARFNGIIEGPGVSIRGDDKNEYLHLDGGSQGSNSGHVVIPSGVFSRDQKDVTIQIRMRWNGVNGCVYPFNMGRDNLNYLSWIVSCGGNTRMEASKDGSQTQMMGNTPTRDRWVTGTVVLKGGQSLTYYLDGKFISQRITSLHASDFQGTSKFSGYLGKSFYNDPYFGGDIDDFRIWNRAVSTSELFEKPFKSITGISLDKTMLTLSPGESSQLRAKVSPADASDKSVSWSSSDPMVVSVDSSGRLQALHTGSATVTVKTTDGGWTASARVTVEAPSTPSQPSVPSAPSVDKTGLVDEVVKAGQTGLAAFTSSSAKRLSDALSAARAVLSDSSASRSDVDAALKALRAAFSSLVSCPALAFRDVKESDWYYSAVSYVDCRGIMTGYADGRSLFGANDRLLRVDAATLLWRRAGRPSVKTRTHYRDQKLIPGYARMAVNWAAETHVMNGYGAQNRFGARSFLTRQEAAKIIAVASGHKVGEPSREALESYNKLGNASSTFPGLLRFMVWAHESGAISGWDTPHGRDADPWGIVTRAQMAQIIANAMQKRVFVGRK